MGSPDANHKDCESTQVSKSPFTTRELLWTGLVVVAVTWMRVVITEPNLALANWYVGGLGVGAQVLIGQPIIDGDFANGIAQARALLDPTARVFDPLVQLFPLIGVDWDVAHGHPRFPAEIPLYLAWAAFPFTSLPYQLMSYALPVLLTLALAWSLRLMNVPILAAWTVTLVFVVTPIGNLAIESTYPLAALAFAVTWRFRDRPLLAAAGLLIAGSGRLVSLLPSLYFATRQRWKTLVYLAIGMVILLLIAVALEPSIVSDFFSRGLYWVSFNTERLDNASLIAVLKRPYWGYGIALIIFLIAVRVSRLRYWSLVWLSAAIAPIAWTFAVAALFPLAAYLWMDNSKSRVFVAGGIVAVFATQSYAGFSYAVFIILLGFALVVASWSRKPSKA